MVATVKLVMNMNICVPYSIYWPHVQKYITLDILFKVTQLRQIGTSVYLEWVPRHVAYQEMNQSIDSQISIEK
jgi:hypothetical protein